MVVIFQSLKLLASDATSMLSLLFSDCESVGCCSLELVLVSSDACRAVWLALTSTVLFYFSVWMNEVFMPLRIMKVAGTVGDVSVALKKTGSHRSKSVTAGIIIFCPGNSSTENLPRVLEMFRRVIKAFFRKAPNDSFRFGLQA